MAVEHVTWHGVVWAVEVIREGAVRRVYETHDHVMHLRLEVKDATRGGKD